MFRKTFVALLAIFASFNVEAAPISCAIQSLRAAVTSPAWTLAYLNLADFTYFNTTQAKINAVEALPTLPGCVGQTGSWKVIWGPTQANQSNLAFIAEYSVKKEPVFAAIVIRGTDVMSGDLYKQVIEDANAAKMIPWTKVADKTNFVKGDCEWKDGTTGAKVAQGTCTGLITLMNITNNGLPTGTTIRAFMETYTKANPLVPIVVTGHSLGGCQTTTVSLYLKPFLTKVNPKVIMSAVPFAPPTAGNIEWATLWNTAFSKTSSVWLNNKDGVPYAYTNVSRLLDLWVPTVPALPIKPIYTLGGAINLMYGLTKDLNYTQPNPSNWLNGYIVSTATNFTSQEVAQHYPDMYYRLICQQFVVGGPKNVLDYPFPGTPTSPTYKNCAAGIAAIPIPSKPQVTTTTTKVVTKATTTTTTTKKKP